MFIGEIKREREREREREMKYDCGFSITFRVPRSITALVFNVLTVLEIITVFKTVLRIFGVNIMSFTRNY